MQPITAPVLRGNYIVPSRYQSWTNRMQAQDDSAYFKKHPMLTPISEKETPME